jgi:hypothetical protein
MGIGLPFRIMYFFTGSSDKMPFLAMWLLSVYAVVWDVSDLRWMKEMRESQSLFCQL